MDKNKKTKLFVRVLCAILALIMTLGVILPVAYAAEVESPYMNGDGFEYVEMDGEWYLNPTTENPVMRLSNVPDTMTRGNLPIVICNIETFKVYSANLLNVYGYVSMAEIPEGYYFIIANNYAWEDDMGYPWVINNAETYYFYHGDTANFEQGKYDLTYAICDGVLDIPMTRYNGSDIPAIKSNATFHLDEADKLYPLDELHNLDELMNRMEHLDLEASLETGHPVYTDDYVPNSDPAYVAPDNITVSGSEAPGVSNLGNLASAGAITNTSNTEEAPAAQPDIIVNNPSVTAPSSGVTAEDLPVETKPAPETETQPENVLDVLTGALETETGINVTSKETTKDYVKSILIKTVIYGVVFAAVAVAYIFIKQKNMREQDLQHEFDLYDDSRLE